MGVDVVEYGVTNGRYFLFVLPFNSLDSRASFCSDALRHESGREKAPFVTFYQMIDFKNFSITRLNTLATFR